MLSRLYFSVLWADTCYRHHQGSIAEDEVLWMEGIGHLLPEICTFLSMLHQYHTHISWLHRYAKVDPLYVPTHQDRIVPRKNTYQLEVVVGSFVRCAQTDVSVGSSENGRKR